MDLNVRINNSIDITYRLFRYNLKIIFANKFIYFFMAAVIFFLLVTVISLFSDSDPTAGSVYYLLMFPGILLIFYPTTYGIQNDVDSGMIEIIFGIPNYRYKVWLARMAIIYIIVFLILMLLTLISASALVAIPMVEMVYQLMFPIFFLGSVAFMFSTLIKNGNGTAVAMVVIGLVFWIAGGIFGNGKWNIFLNPFQVPSDINETIWENIVANNRIYLSAGSLLAMLYGLLNLQKREKFI